MTKKRTMTLNLNEKEMDTLEVLSVEKGLSKTQLMRQALRLYQSVSDRFERGDKLFIEDAEKKEKLELMVL